MRAIAEALFAAESTSAKKAKADALARALRDVAARDPTRLPFAARFLTGTMLATVDERILGTGGALVFEAACAASGMIPEELGARARAAGDLGTAVGEALAARRPAHDEAGLDLSAAEAVAEALARTGSREAKLAALSAALVTCTPNEGRYLVRAVLGEMRVGAREGIALDAIAKAFGRPLEDVRRAGAVVADIGELARLAFEDRLSEARMVLGRPVDFMLATPIETARGVNLELPHAVEDKIDGIRAQAHVSPDGVRLFARGKGSVTIAFPDIVGPLEDAARATLPPAILDGEIVVVAPDGRPRPFSALQPRLRKTAPDDVLLRDHPVRYLVYDLLFESGQEVISLPFLERRALLADWVRKAPSPVVLHDSRPLVSKKKAALDSEFERARARGFEGLVLKRLDAPYRAGVRGFAWLKVKRAFATLDVVIVAAERGHGKRAGVLSDYTFAVWNESELVTVGKAYSGLTDAEIRTTTDRLTSLALVEERRGYLPVRPEIVLEVAFDGIQRSTRHASGFALRFPRIARIRDDKRPEDADTIETVKKLFESQIATGHREDRGHRSGRRPDVRRASRQLKLFEDE